MAQEQTAALSQTLTVVDDVNSVNRAQATLAQELEGPCPANLTPGTFPGYDCGNGPPTSATQRKAAEVAVAKAKAQLGAAEHYCLMLLSRLKNGDAGKYILKRSNCEVSPGPPPRDSPGP